MNKWAELVMAWIVGGLFGRLIGHTYLVGHLGWPEFSGWLSVPIGAVAGWLWVERKALAPAFRHAYRWTQKPARLASWAESFSRAREHLVADGHEFKSNWCWRVLNAVSIGLLIGLWLVVLGVLSAIAGVNADKTVSKYAPLIGGGICFVTVTCLSMCLAVGSGKFLAARGWDKFFEKRTTGNAVRDDAVENFLGFLQINPVSVFGILLLIAVPYYIGVNIKEVIVWIGQVLWKTIRMVNSSQRMAAMTGATIGLSISQIYGFNPVICSGVCVVSGLVERFVFALAEKAVLRLRARRTA